MLVVVFINRISGIISISISISSISICSIFIIISVISISISSSSSSSSSSIGSREDVLSTYGMMTPAAWSMSTFFVYLSSLRGSQILNWRCDCFVKPT